MPLPLLHRRGLCLTLLGALLLNALSGPASRADVPPPGPPPQAVVSDSNGFSINLELPGRKVCMVLPETLRSWDACQGIDDVQTLATNMRPRIDDGSLVAAAYLRFDDWNLLTLVMRSRDEIGELDDQCKDEVARDFLTGMHEGATESPASTKMSFSGLQQPAELKRRNGIQFLHLRVPSKTPAASGGTTSITQDYNLIMSDGLAYFVLFAIPEGRAAAAEPVITQVLASIKAIPTTKKYRNEQLKQTAASAGYYAGPPIAVLLFVALIIFARRRDARRR